MKLARTPDGGFRIDPGGGAAALVAVVTGDGWEVRQDPSGNRWSLLRDRSFPGGFVLRDRAGGEPGRTTRETDDDAVPVSLLAPDGRLYRVRRRAAGGARFELSGWEVRGAYLVARVEADGVAIERTDAGEELAVLPEILILFAAEVLDAMVDDARG
jgi:hypothetical protein